MTILGTIIAIALAAIVCLAIAFIAGTVVGYACAAPDMEDDLESREYW